MKTKCAFKHYMKYAWDTKVLCFRYKAIVVKLPTKKY